MHALRARSATLVTITAPSPQPRPRAACPQSCVHLVAFPCVHLVALAYFWWRHCPQLPGDSESYPRTSSGAIWPFLRTSSGAFAYFWWRTPSPVLLSDLRKHPFLIFPPVFPGTKRTCTPTAGPVSCGFSGQRRLHSKIERLTAHALSNFQPGVFGFACSQRFAAAHWGHWCPSGCRLGSGSWASPRLAPHITHIVRISISASLKDITPRTKNPKPTNKTRSKTRPETLD